MNTFAFSATVTGLDIDDIDLLDQLHTDQFLLMPSKIDDVTTIEVEIDAATSEDALKQFTDYMDDFPQITLTRVDEDLVNIKEIALRLDVTQQAARNYASGARAGSTPFPAHRSILAGGMKLWTWVSVYAWAQGADKLVDDLATPLDEKCVDWFNGHLASEALTPTPWTPMPRSFVLNVIQQEGGVPAPRQGLAA